MVIAVRSILTGWAALLLITFLLERPLLFLGAPILAVGWFATARLALDCCAFAATGWIVGHWSRDDSLFAVVAFAATLTLRDFEPLLAINLPWLLHLVADSLRDGRYLESLFTTAATQALLFGSLIAGGRLARPARRTAISVFRG